MKGESKGGGTDGRRDGWRTEGWTISENARSSWVKPLAPRIAYTQSTHS